MGKSQGSDQPIWGKGWVDQFYSGENAYKSVAIARRRLESSGWLHLDLTSLFLFPPSLPPSLQAELDWLKLRQKDLKRKGADDEMPPLKMREKGLLKKLQQGQVN